MAQIFLSLCFQWACARFRPIRVSFSRLKEIGPRGVFNWVTKGGQEAGIERARREEGNFEREGLREKRRGLRAGGPGWRRDAVCRERTLGVAIGFGEVVGGGQSRDGRGRLGDLLSAAFASGTTRKLSRKAPRRPQRRGRSLHRGRSRRASGLRGRFAGVGELAKGFWFRRERADRGADAGGCCPPAPPAEGKGGCGCRFSLQESPWPGRPCALRR